MQLAGSILTYLGWQAFWTILSTPMSSPPSRQTRSARMKEEGRHMPEKTNLLSAIVAVAFYVSAISVLTFVQLTITGM
jgi:hypothetical protein